jgi:hypothetical protein
LVFPSVEFAVFFPVVLDLSWALMPDPRLWKPFALAVSYLFYAAADPKFCVLLAAVTLANQHRARHPRRHGLRPARPRPASPTAALVDAARDSSPADARAGISLAHTAPSRPRRNCAWLGPGAPASASKR